MKSTPSASRIARLGEVADPALRHYGDRHSRLDLADLRDGRHAGDARRRAGCRPGRARAPSRPHAPASSAIFACSAFTTSMMTPPLSISARPTLTRKASDDERGRERKPVKSSWKFLSSSSDLDEGRFLGRRSRRARPRRGPFWRRGLPRELARAGARDLERLLEVGGGPARDGDADGGHVGLVGLKSAPAETRTPFSRAAAASARPDTPSGSRTQRTQPPATAARPQIPIGKRFRTVRCASASRPFRRRRVLARCLS